jgi:hypothetical protein
MQHPQKGIENILYFDESTAPPALADGRAPTWTGLTLLAVSLFGGLATL